MHRPGAGAAQTHGQGRSLVGGDRLRQPPKDRARWTLKPAGPQTREPENRRTLTHRDQEGEVWAACTHPEVERDLLR